MRFKILCDWLKDHKLSTIQIVSFICGKIVLAVIQLPQYETQQTYILELLISTAFFLTSLTSKLLSIPKLVIKEVLMINMRSFLLWIVALLIIIFSFSLSHTLNWLTIQIVFLIITLLFQNQMLILLCNWRYISKVQFVLYQIILAISIMSLGIKTVIFIQLGESQHKDIILLNLTTQIAFAILIMDSIQRSYKRSLQNTQKNLTNQIQQELTMNT